MPELPLTRSRLLEGESPRSRDTKLTEIDKNTLLVEWRGDRTPRQVSVFGGILGYARDGLATLSGCSTSAACYERLLDGPEMATVFWRGERPDMSEVRALLRPA